VKGGAGGLRSAGWVECFRGGRSVSPVGFGTGADPRTGSWGPGSFLADPQFSGAFPALGGSYRPRFFEFAADERLHVF